MTSLEQVRILPYPAKLLFDIVLDVGSYPQFLPWCKTVKVISSETREIIADMTVEFKFITERYRSRISYNESEKSYIINTVALQGPFKYLTSSWQLDVTNANSTNIKFTIDFQFKSLLLDKIVGIFFYTALERMIQAFETRAHQLSHRLS